MISQYVDLDSAASAINQDGSYLHQKNGLWGLYDNGESPHNPVVPYSFQTPADLILWYFDDMGWDLTPHKLDHSNELNQLNGSIYQQSPSTCPKCKSDYHSEVDLQGNVEHSECSECGWTD